MPNPPGCPDRKIVGIERPARFSRFEGQGLFLKLDCGHQLWRASSSPRAAALSLLHTTTACLSGCYVPQRAMFDA